MDPTQCYLEMYETMRQGDLATARERALALKDWLDRGGFSPPNYSSTEVRSYLACCVARRESKQPARTTHDIEDFRDDVR